MFIAESTHSTGSIRWTLEPLLGSPASVGHTPTLVFAHSYVARQGGRGQSLTGVLNFIRITIVLERHASIADPSLDWKEKGVQGGGGRKRLLLLPLG